MWYAFTPTHQFLGEREDIAIWEDVCQGVAVKILDNGIAVIEGDTHISKWVEMEGRLDHDQNSLPIILEHIKEGDWVVDGGACIGDHTIAYLNKVGSQGHVLAFEPNHLAFECLKHNCKGAACLPFGLSDLSGNAGILQNPNSGASRLVNGDGIILVRLDDYELPRLDFLKLDVEGWELKALRGAESTIEKHRPIMWIEINKGALAEQGAEPKDIMRFLFDYDYDFSPYPEEGGPQYDLLCIPCK
jgi:FkbM family methyltransferase